MNIIKKTDIKTRSVDATADAGGNVYIGISSKTNIPLAFVPDNVGFDLRRWQFGSYNNSLYIVWNVGSERVRGTIYYIEISAL